VKSLPPVLPSVAVPEPFLVIPVAPLILPAPLKL
jgi:hypothetical protein